jgi:hypothetical protein
MLFPMIWDVDGEQMGPSLLPSVIRLDDFNVLDIFVITLESGCSVSSYLLLNNVKNKLYIRTVM